MSIIFNKKLVTKPSELRALNSQWGEVKDLRVQSEKDMKALLQLTGNAARTPAEAYREMDATTKIDMKPAGEFSTLTRLLQVARPVSIGKEVFEYRKASDVDGAQTSMGGQIGVKLDHVDYKYAGTIVPIHDKGFGRRWREIQSMQADGFDALVDDAREAEHSLMTQMNSFMWNGDANLSLKGNSWLGIKADPSVASATLGVDLSASATAAADIRGEVARIRDILYITNNCTQPLRLGVSREILSNWEREYSSADGMFGTIEDFVAKLRGIDEIYEDSELSGNEIVLFALGQDAFHPVVGMAINTYAVPRQFHNSDFNFIKWTATGFLAKTDYENRKCVLFAD